MAVTRDGSTLYVAAFGSSKIGVFQTTELEDDRLWDGRGAEFDPTEASSRYLSVSGGGPSGLALDETRGRLYVTTRFDNGLSVFDLETGNELTHLSFHNPEPASVVEGRPMLYDASRTSSNGEASCSSCHVFGDFDSLAWDLGNPDEPNTTNPLPINFESTIGIDGDPFALYLNGTGRVRDFSSMKGPMATQTLRGLAHSGHMHWRGDRSTGFFGTDDPHTADSRLSFMNFIVAFEGLLGSGDPPTDRTLQSDMEKFTDFMLQVVLPPNPIRRLDNKLSASQQRGRDFFMGPRRSDGFATDFGGGGEQLGFTCEECHRLDPAQGFYGTGGDAAFEGETQIMKTAHLRNMYQKVGMFGLPNRPGFNRLDSSHLGDQVRGVGILHDGATDTIFSFLQGSVFNNQGDVGFNGGQRQRRDVEQYMFAFESDLAPIVGQQITLSASSTAAMKARLNLLEQRSASPFTSKILGGPVTECELIAKGVVGGAERGYLFRPNRRDYRSDRASEAPVSAGRMRALARQAGHFLTFTCVPPGSGVRMALDRDEDGVFDRDERDQGTNPNSE